MCRLTWLDLLTFYTDNMTFFIISHKLPLPAKKINTKL